MMILDKTYWANKLRDRSAIAAIGACSIGLYAVLALTPVGPALEGRLGARGIAMLLPSFVRPTMPEEEILAEGRRAAEVAALFERIGYRFETVASGGAAVPRLIAADLPVEMKTLADAETRKRVFALTLLPVILMENEKLTAERERLIALRARLVANKSITRADHQWLNAMMETYRVRNASIDELIKRVDVVPPSLAIAQAAQETGWGTSRFAQKGNALFGQWTWAEEGGIVPAQRKAGMTHKIKAFETPAEAVAAFFLNLNRHRAYAPFRMLRAKARAGGATVLDGLPLAAGLLQYSELGGDYVMAVRRLIQINGLDGLDAATLAPRGETIDL